MDYEQTVRESLEKLGYEPRRIERMSPYLVRQAQFLARGGRTVLSADFFDYETKAKNMACALKVDLALIVRSGMYDTNILTADAQTVRERVEEAAKRLHIPTLIYVKALLPMHAHAMGRLGETIEQNVSTAAAAFDMPLHKYVAICLGRPELFTQNGEKLNRTIDATAEKIGLTRAQYIKAGLKEPALFYKKPETTARNVEDCAAVLGLTPKDYVALVLKQKQEQLFIRAPKTFAANADATSALLGIDRETYIMAARKRLTMLAYDPNTLNAKIGTMASLLNVTAAEALDAFLDAPILFTLDINKINEKVTKLAELLDVNKDKLARKLVREGPSALYQNPETVNARIEKVVELTGIPKGTYVGFAMNKTNLLWRSPETVAQNFHLMQLFNSKGIINRDPAEFYAKKPEMLAMSPTNFYLRYLYARATGMKDLNDFGLLRASRAEMERKMVLHFGHDPEQTIITRPALRGDHQPPEEKRHAAMIGLIQRGIISTYEYKPEI